MIKKKFLQKSNMDIKNAEFDADFDTVKKKLMRKKLSKKSDRKMKFLTVITVCKGFSAYKFVCLNFLHLFQQIRTQH
jgi:hypothetical protein